MEIFGYLGLLGSVALLIWMALRGVDTVSYTHLTLPTSG